MTPRLLLASASPRRRRLLAFLGVTYDVGVVDVPEDATGGPADATAFAERIATEKALAARTAYEKTHTIIAADTVVAAEGRILGKPRDRANAEWMLRRIAGRTHTVVTAFAVFLPDADRPIVRTVTSKVLMHDLDEPTIEEWVARGELLGCAGAYNIEQHLASVAPTECYQSVAGLPLCHLYLLLREVVPDLPGLTPPLASCEAVRSTRCDLGRSLLSLDARA